MVVVLTDPTALTPSTAAVCVEFKVAAAKPLVEAVVVIVVSAILPA